MTATLPLPDAGDLDGLPVASAMTRDELAEIYSDVNEILAAARLADGRIALDLGGSICIDRPETADAFGLDLLAMTRHLVSPQPGNGSLPYAPEPRKLTGADASAQRTTPAALRTAA